MSVNDFVILPGSKTGVSVKLKAKSVRELQLEKVHLELENKEMEKKLQQLQSNMSREKQEREQANGYHWKSGQAGLCLQPQLLSQNKENVGKIPSGKVKLRVLKQQIQVPQPAKQSVARKLANVSAAEKPKIKGKACGQCETKAALLVCLECGEDYCPTCFARVHQKGALKHHRTTSLQAKTYVSVGKLEAAQNFLKTIHPEQSNGWINNEQKKKTGDMLEETLDLPSPLPKMSANNIEEATVPCSEIRSESQSGGSLFYGIFDEEESAKSFQEALNQWRSGNSSPKSKKECSSQIGSENSDTSQVQTSPPTEKKPIEIEFKEDSLKYMEKLLIKKHRRAPVDKLPDSIIADELKLEKSLLNETHDSWVGEDEEDENEIAIARFAADEMKKYLTDVFRQEEPEIHLTDSEPSLKIKILEDAYEEEPEEPTSCVVMEAGSDELIDSRGAMSKSQKNEPDIFLAQADNITTRSPLSATIRRENNNNNCEETFRARTPSQSEGAEAACGCSSAEETFPSTPFEREPFATMELPKDCKICMELNEASRFTTKSSMFLQVVQREKPTKHPYQGLGVFFTLGNRCQQVMMDSFSSFCASRHSRSSSSISFSGNKKWMKHLSLGKYADECVVQDVLERELRRPSSRCSPSPSPRSHLSVLSMENATPRPFSANIPFYRTVNHTSRASSALEARSKCSANLPLSRAASEISEIEGIDISEHDDPSWEHSTDKKTLADLADELQSNSDPSENLSSLTSGDFNRQSKITCQNLPDFHHNHEINDYSKDDTIRIYDESHTDDEEDQKAKQEVIELH